MLDLVPAGVQPECYVAFLAGKWRSLPEAEVVAFEARRAFDRMDSMEVIATAAEVKKLLADRPGAYLLFPEDRRFPIRMMKDLPRRWTDRRPGLVFRGAAMRNEFYVFQIGVYAARANLRDLAVQFCYLLWQISNFRYCRSLPHCRSTESATG